MTPMIQNQTNTKEAENHLYRELDKGIRDMENGHTISHEDMMKLLRERIAPDHV